MLNNFKDCMLCGLFYRICAACALGLVVFSANAQVDPKRNDCDLGNLSDRRKCMCAYAPSMNNVPKWWDGAPQAMVASASGASPVCATTYSNDDDSQWLGSSALTMNDSTRDVNIIRAISGIITDANATVCPTTSPSALSDTLFLSFSVEASAFGMDPASVDPTRLSKNAVRIILRGRDTFSEFDYLTVIPHYFAVVMRLVASTQGINGVIQPGQVIVSIYKINSVCDITENCSADLEVAPSDPLIPSPDPVIQNGSEMLATIASTARSWVRPSVGGSPPNFIIRFALPTNLMQPIEPTGKAFKIWYGIDVDNPAATMANYQGAVGGGEANSAEYSWPGGRSNPGFDPDLGRQYPSMDNWGTLMIDEPGGQCAWGVKLDGQTIAVTSPNPPMITTSPAHNIIFADPAAVKIPTAVPPAPDITTGLKANFSVTAWGSPPLPSQTIQSPGSAWNPAPCAGGINPTLLGSNDSDGNPFYRFTCDYTGTANPSPSAQGLLVALSDAGGFNLPYINKEAANQYLIALQASKIEQPAVITIKGLKPLSQPGTRDLYISVIPSNMPKYTKRMPSGAGKTSNDEMLRSEIRKIIERLDTRPTLKQQQYAGSGRYPDDKYPALTVDQLQYGVTSGEIKGGTLRQLLSDGYVTREMIDEALPSYRVRVFHDTGLQEKAIDKQSGQVKMRDVLEAQSAFGFVATHQGDLTGWRHDLIFDDIPACPVASTAAGTCYRKLAPNVYKVSRLPNDGSIRVTTYVEAVEPKPWSIGLLLGAAIPTGPFGDHAKAGPATTLTLEREWMAFNWPPMISAAATLGIARMPGDGTQPLPDATVRDVGVGLKVYLNQPADWRVYAMPMVDTYHFSNGSTKSGTSLALGLQYEWNPAWALDLRYGAHRISSNAPQSSFSTLQAGVRYSF